MSDMTEIPRRLRKGTLRGLWRWESDADPELIEQAGAKLSWHTEVLDTEEATDKEGFLQACSDTFSLPSWFGMNWDALLDCLSSLDVGEAEGILIAWTGWQNFAEADSEEFYVALDVLRDTTTRWESDGVPGAIVVVGEGPSFGLKSL